MRVWISGGSGFVGSHLVRAFEDVCAPAHAEVDVTDADAVRRCASVRRSTDSPFPIPYDTSLDARATAATLGVELPSLDDQLARLERSIEVVRA